MQRLKQIPILSVRIESWEKPAADKPNPFKESLQRLVAWVSHHDGALPKQCGDSPEEISLARWLTGQGHRCKSGTMGAEQLAGLKHISALSERIQCWGKASEHLLRG